MSGREDVQTCSWLVIKLLLNVWCAIAIRTKLAKLMSRFVDVENY